MKMVRVVVYLVIPMLLAIASGGQNRPQVSPKLTANIPFDFMVHEAMFPGGNYIITPAGEGTFKLRARDGKAWMKFTVDPLRAARPASTALIFSHVGGHLLLREVWMSATTGVAVSRPAREELRWVSASRVEVPAQCADCQ